MNTSIGIIGGADGPTAIYVSPSLSGAVIPAFGITLALMALLYFTLYRRGKLKVACLGLSEAAMIFCDRYVKVLTMSLELDETAPFIPGILQFRRVHNYGAAWSSLSGARWLLVAVTAVGLGVLTWLLVKIVRHPLGQWALTMVIAGGIGNLVDRVCLGYVIDMLDVTLFSYPVFNIADCFVVVGTIMALIYYLNYYAESDAKNWEKTDGKDASSAN